MGIPENGARKYGIPVGFIFIIFEKMSISSDLQELLDKYTLLSIDHEKGKVICTGTGHEMPIKAEAVKSYVAGKKFKKVKEYKELVAELGKHKEFIIPSNKPQCAKLYFCKLTLRHLNRDAEHVRKHVNGKRFQRALKRWEECQEKGIAYTYPGRRPKKDVKEQEGSDEGEEDEEEAEEKMEQKMKTDDDWAKDFYPDEEEDEDGNGESDGEFKDLSNDDDDDFKDLSDEEEPPKQQKKVKGKKKKQKAQNGQENGSSQITSPASAKKRKAPQNDGPSKKKSKKKQTK